MADYDFPDALRYSAEDEWTRIEGERATIGITDYAQQQLGDIVFVELPEVGRNLERGEPFGVIESVKAVSDLFAPVSGTVVGSADLMSEMSGNEGLRERPEAVNEACYGDGWMVVVALTEPGELDSLLDAGAYAQHVKERED